MRFGVGAGTPPVSLRLRAAVVLGAVILISAAATRVANAADDVAGFAKPQFDSHLWLELGGDWEHYTGGDARGFPPSERFPTIGLRPTDGFGYEGRLSYRPADSSRIFSLAVRYGRTSQRDGDNEQPFRIDNSDNNQVVLTQHREHRLVADLEAGRDVGEGEFNFFSIGSLGVRYVDFRTTTNESFGGTGPDLVLGGADVRRGLRAAGPRIAWHASMPLPPPFDDANVFLGWDVAGSVLFGRQTVQADAFGSEALSRSHAAIVPNVEGRLNFGWHVPGTTATAKLGVRSEAFYNVLDGGVASRHALRRIDYGPFFSVVWSLR